MGEKKNNKEKNDYVILKIGYTSYHSKGCVHCLTGELLTKNETPNV